MFLATLDVLGPVAGVRVLVVQESANAQLLGGRTVPAGPVPGARSLVTEYAVQPVTVVSRYRAVCEKNTDDYTSIIIIETKTERKCVCASAVDSKEQKHYPDRFPTKISEIVQRFQ